jgi:Ca2+/Na+ antiporter
MKLTKSQQISVVQVVFMLANIITCMLCYHTRLLDDNLAFWNRLDIVLLIVIIGLQIMIMRERRKEKKRGERKRAA